MRFLLLTLCTVLFGCACTEQSAPADKSPAEPKQETTAVDGERVEGTFEGRKYWLETPKNFRAKNTAGIFVYFHGDGSASSSGARKQTFDSRFRGFGLEEGMLELFAIAEKGSWWMDDGFENAMWVRNLLLDEVFPQYDLQDVPVYLLGYSGGAHFITRFFLPNVGYEFRGKAIMVGGGAGPPSTSRAVRKVDQCRNQWTLHFRVHEDDYMTKEVAEGSGFYEEEGFELTVDQSGNGGHSYSDGEFEAVFRKVTSN